MSRSRSPRRDICAICHDGSPREVALPCGHRYHPRCVERLCDGSAGGKCPLCRHTFGIDALPYYMHAREHKALRERAKAHYPDGLAKMSHPAAQLYQLDIKLYAGFLQRLDPYLNLKPFHPPRARLWSLGHAGLFATGDVLEVSEDDIEYYCRRTNCCVVMRRHDWCDTMLRAEFTHCHEGGRHVLTRTIIKYNHEGRAAETERFVLGASDDIFGDSFDSDGWIYNRLAGGSPELKFLPEADDDEFYAGWKAKYKVEWPWVRVEYEEDGHKTWVRAVHPHSLFDGMRRPVLAV